jgi:lactoylglutathione lyase
MIKFNLFVIYTFNLELNVRFYRALGLELTEEQHGNGPTHYSTEINGMVVEFYPLTPTNITPSSIRIGVEVTDFFDVVNSDILRPVIVKQTDRMITLVDPDGRKVDVILTKH